MTKQFGVQILLDDHAAKALRKGLRADEGRLRTIARVRPVGMSEPVLATQLLIPESAEGSLSNTAIKDYELAWRAVEAGAWDTGRLILDKLPEKDGPSNFLRKLLSRFNDEAPPTWDGAIRLSEK